MKLTLTAINQSDVPAISMLVFALLSLAVVASIFFHIIKNKDAQPTLEEELIESSLKKPTKNNKPKQTKNKQQPAPWERDADWWKF